MLRPALFPLALASLAAPCALQAQVRPAQELIDASLATAKVGNRTVLVAFHASWCSWCKRLEGALARPAVKEIMDRRFVTLWLTVQERGPLKATENPGAAELYAKWTGDAKAGIPFYAVLDAQGAPRSTSIRPLAPGAKAENLGYPGSAEEIAGFIALLREGAPSLTDAEAAVLRSELEAAKPKPKA